MARPVGPLLREALAAGLIVVRPAQHVEQLGQRRAVAARGGLDHLLDQVIARDVARKLVEVRRERGGTPYPLPPLNAVIAKFW